MAKREIGALVIGGFFALCGLATIGAGFYAMGSDIAFAARAETAEARVEAVRTEWRRNSKVYVADLHFVTRGGEEIRVPAMRPNSWMRHAAGDIVQVRYDPAEPRQASLELLALRLLGASIALPFGIVFAAFGWTIATAPARWPMGVFAGSGAALVLLLAVLIAANEVEEALVVRRATALATAEVIGHRTMTRGDDGDVYAARLHFTAQDGRSVVVETEDWNSRPRPLIGELLTLRYLLDNPELAAPNQPVMMWLRPILAVTVPTLLLGGGALLYRRFRRRGANPARRA